MYSSQFITDCGPGFVYASGDGIIIVEIPDMHQNDPVINKEMVGSESSELTVYAAYKLQRYFNGEHIDFGDIPVDLSRLTPFRQRVLHATRTLQYGEICCYYQLAGLCGSPRAARAVGGALAANPIPVIIPCHRVVASTGHLTGFSAPGGIDTKYSLLKMEGVEFNGLLPVINHLVMHRISGC